MRSIELKILLAGALVALLLALPGPANGAAKAATPYSAPMVVPAAAFISDGVDPDGFEFRNGGLEGLGIPVHMVAPVYLPDGATITGLRAYIHDASNDCGGNREDVDIFLVRTSMVDGFPQTVAITTSSGANGSVDLEPTHTLFASRATVDTGNYLYWLNMRLCSRLHRVNAVVIDY